MPGHRVLCVAAALVALTSAFTTNPVSGLAGRQAPVRRAPEKVLLRMSDAPTMSAPTRARIEALVGDNKVMLFMKGSKIFPQCGFSNMAVQILNAIGTDYETCDVLADMDIRSGIKEFSDWPTIPQLYVNGEFVGGSDIMLEMYQDGELQEMIEVAAAS
mmetsp:Transcript_22591/g.89699  ORF Transcript_22591/g.89699 Transcript_22591/m.89699 type:complete len:159 (-) Transcript_22591:242-718(-)